LADRNVQHLLVGLNEAHGEAIGAMAAWTAFGAGVITSAEARAKLATFVVASRRQRDVPDFARYLTDRGNITAQTLKERVNELEAGLQAAQHDVELLVERAASFWPDLHIRSGESEWQRAVGSFRSLARSAVFQARDRRRAIEQLLSDCDQARTEGLTGFEELGDSPIRLMNFHQTKGREVDAALLVFCADEYFGPNEGEPHPKLSRLLYVALTRARREIVVILPPNPHAVLAPLRALQSPGPR
ncbi:MAG: 3'-5' exonuclease, partial [Dehalococcoidia bacterium]